MKKILLQLPLTGAPPRRLTGSWEILRHGQLRISESSFDWDLILASGLCMSMPRAIDWSRKKSAKSWRPLCFEIQRLISLFHVGGSHTFCPHGILKGPLNVSQNPRRSSEYPAEFEKKFTSKNRKKSLFKAPIMMMKFVHKRNVLFPAFSTPYNGVSRYNQQNRI